MQVILVAHSHRDKAEPHDTAVYLTNLREARNF